MKDSNAIWRSYSQNGSIRIPPLGALVFENIKFLKRKFKNPFKALCIFLISFYQKHLSRHTCLYFPTCSEYTKRCINNWGVLTGIILGLCRILRCNPFSRGGIDPAPEVFWKLRWLV